MHIILKSKQDVALRLVLQSLHVLASSSHRASPASASKATTLLSL